MLRHDVDGARSRVFTNYALVDVREGLLSLLHSARLKKHGKQSQPR